MIEFHNVCAGYYGIEVLHNITVTLERGKVTVIVGPNGCGKSTLLKALIRLNPHSSGNILVNGIKLLHIQPCRSYKNKRNQLDFFCMSIIC